MTTQVALSFGTLTVERAVRERRSSVRLKVARDTHAHITTVDVDGAPIGVEASSDAVLGDISLGGAFLETPRALEPGARLSVELQLGGLALRIPAVVVRCAKGGVGVQFQHDRETHRALTAALARLGTPKQRRVLVVDDDALARRLLEDTFRERGYEVVTAPDATYGLYAVGEYLLNLDLLVTDAFMPGFDGEGFIHAIRNSGGELDLPILVATARPEPDLRARLLGAGADSVVGKGCGASAIADAAEALMQGARTGRGAASRPALACEG